MLVGWLVGLLVCWFVGLLVCWFVDLLVCWFVGLLVCWLVGLLALVPFTIFSKLVIQSLLLTLCIVDIRSPCMVDIKKTGAAI